MCEPQVIGIEPICRRRCARPTHSPHTYGSLIASTTTSTLVLSRSSHLRCDQTMGRRRKPGDTGRGSTLRRRLRIGFT